MTKKKEKENEKNIEHSLKMRKKFSLADAIASKAGGGIFKGASTVPIMTQLRMEINQFVKDNIKDSSGALKATLNMIVNENDLLVADNEKDPLNGLKQIIDKILKTDYTLHEFVRKVDQKYGQMYSERPYFQKPGQTPHEDDEYTHESVKSALQTLLEKMKLFE